MLTYFETLCVDTTAANVLINSSLTMLFVRMLRNSRAPLLRARLASVLGLLVRHATFIAEELAATQVGGRGAQGLCSWRAWAWREQRMPAGAAAGSVQPCSGRPGCAVPPQCRQSAGLGAARHAVWCSVRAATRPGRCAAPCLEPGG